MNVNLITYIAGLADLLLNRGFILISFFPLTYVLTQQFYHPKLENVNQFNHKTSSRTIRNVLECTRMLGGNNCS